ncbi:MAG: hypothetical protein WCG25_05520 [bacterium]
MDFLIANRLTKDTQKSNRESTAEDISAILQLIRPTISLVLAKTKADDEAKRIAFFS